MRDTAPVVFTAMVSSLLLILVIIFVLARSKTLELRLILIGVFTAIAAAVQGNVSAVSIDPGSGALSLGFSAGSLMKNPGGVQTHCTNCENGVLVVLAVDRRGEEELRFTLGRINLHRQNLRGPDQDTVLPALGDDHCSLFDSVPLPQRGGDYYRSPLAARPADR